MELELLRKLPASIHDRRRMVDVADPTLRVRRHGKLLRFSRSSIYYQAVPESALNLHLMRLIDE